MKTAIKVLSWLGFAGCVVGVVASIGDGAVDKWALVATGYAFFGALESGV